MFVRFEGCEVRSNFLRNHWKCIHCVCSKH